MFLGRPHLRFDGLYVSRNTYIRTGLVEWRVRNPVHLVCYYRYLRFFPDGTLLYRTSPDIVANVASSMVTPGRSTKQGQPVQDGRFRLNVRPSAAAGLYIADAPEKRSLFESSLPCQNNC